MRSNYLLSTLILVVVAVALPGCGSDLARVEGVVTLDGEPLPNARIVFEAPDRPMAVATTDEQGRYQVMTGGQKGMAAGSYRVAVSAYQTREVPGGLEAPIPVLRTPKRYNSASTSGFSADIKEGSNDDVDFALTSASAAGSR